MLLWTDKYLGDTTHLTTVEHGAYLLILMAMWRAGGSLPNDETRLARTARLPLDKWRKIAPVVTGFLTIEESTVTQKRLKLEFEKASSRMDKLKAAGSAGGNAKALKNKNKIPGDARVEPLPGEKPASTTENWKLDKGRDLKVSCPKRVRTRKEYTEKFEGFWSAYPTDPNMSKKDAFEAFGRLSDLDQDTAIAAVPSFKRYCESHPDYRPVHAVRFLRSRRFDGFGQVAQRESSRFYAKIGSPQFNAWNTYKRDSGDGRSVPTHMGGWWFDSEWPPGHEPPRAYSEAAE